MCRLNRLRKYWRLKNRAMNNIELNKVAIQSIGIDTIRLPGVGSASAKGSGSLFHKSLVDAWFMSGYSNDNPPASIKGYKGHELVLKNFAFTSNSGFGGSVDHSGGNDEGKAASSYEGSLVFDGVDDYAVCYNMPIQTDYTVICRRQIININNSSAVASKRTYPNDIGFLVLLLLKELLSMVVRLYILLGKIMQLIRLIQIK